MTRKLLFLFASLLISLTSFAQVVANQPPDLEVCDDNLDEFYDWDLTQQDAIILGDQDPALFIVSYHLTQQDANNELNALSSPYTNTVNPETIYATVSDLANGVNATTSFNLIVNTLPVNSFSSVMLVCSDDPSGFGVFDLTIYDSQFTQGNAALDVTYFVDLNDAFNNINAITNPTAFVNTTPITQDIFVRVEDSITGCFFVNSDNFINLVVDFIPITSTLTPLTACDDTGSGFTAFNLMEADFEVQAGQNNNLDYVITYHETQADADNNTNALVSPYTNITNPQTIFVRITSLLGGCFNITTLELLVETSCFTINPAELYACDDTGNGFVDFFLPDANAQILGTLDPASYTLSYFLTTDDAINEINPLSDIYTSNTQTVIVKVNDNTTGEYELTTLSLNVQPIPIIDFLPSYDICDGQSLTLVVGTQTTGIYDAEWSLDGVVLPIDGGGTTTFALTVSSAGVYSVVITEINSGCTATASTVVSVGDSLNLVPPSDLTDCDVNAIGTVFFDLTSQNTTVLNGLDPTTHPISFYLNQQDADLQQNPITNANNFEVSNSQVVFMLVENPNGTCSSIFPIQLVIDNCPTTIDCNSGPVNTVFCYANDGSATYTYTSSDGNPLTVFFNSGFVENSWDELIVLDSDGITNLNAATPYGNAGDVSGLSFTSSGDTISVFVDSDGIFSCETEGYQPLDFDVQCVDTTAPPNCNAVLTSPLNGDTNV